MKKIGLLAILLLLVTAGLAYAELEGAEPPQGQEPLLITNAGQGPGGKMGRLLVTRAEAAVASAAEAAEAVFNAINTSMNIAINEE